MVACTACGSEPVEPPPPPMVKSLPEGGEIRIERAKVPAFISPDQQLISAHAYFLDAASGRDPIPLPEVGTCSDLRVAAMPWPLRLPDPAVFADVGAQIRLSSSDTNVIFDRQTNAPGAGVSSQQHFDIGYVPRPAELQQIGAESTYAITLDGAEAPNPAILTMPPEIEPVTTGTIPFSRGNNETIEYRARGGLLSSEDKIAIALIDTSKPLITHLCLYAPNEQQATIPAAILAGAAPKGLFLFGTYRHELSEWRGRRFDRVTIDWNSRLTKSVEIIREGRRGRIRRRARRLHPDR